MKTKEIIKEKVEKIFRENSNKNIFYKTNPSGVSLIVLVITIIVIIILAVAVILTLNKINPIEEANRARYESDVANIQAIFTNTVAKVMAQNQGIIEINVGEINSVKIGENSAEGRINYTINNPENSENKEGTIIFDMGDNTLTTYYTGRKLPLYSTGETTWYVDSEGIISLQIGDKEYGVGEKKEDLKSEIQINESENPMFQAWARDATTDFHAEEYRSKITKVKFGIFDKVPINRIDVWDISEKKDGSIMAWVEDDGTDGYILTIAGKEKILANSNARYLFINMKNLREIENLEVIEDLSQIYFFGCEKITNIDLSKVNMTKVNEINFNGCISLKSINFGNLLGCKVSKLEFSGCSSLVNLNLNGIDTSNMTEMGSMFHGCKNLKTLILGNNFDMSKVTSTWSMFRYCYNLTTTINFNSDNLQSITHMFDEASTIPPAKIVVNYTEKTGKYLDNQVFPCIGNSNIVKGVQI